MDAPVYLGDGVYGHNTGYQLKLMAGSHDKPTDVIYINDDNVRQLEELIAVWRQKRGKT